MKTMLRSVLASVIVAATFAFAMSASVQVGVRLNAPNVVTQDTFNALQNVSVLVETKHGLGTGVLVTRQLGDDLRAYVWTAGHVVKGEQRPDGTFNDVTIVQEVRQGGLLVRTRTTPAKVISYSDPELGDDLALLEISEANWTSASATFADDTVLPIGTPLVHVGCMLGLYDSTSLGVMSQTDRHLPDLPKPFDQTSCIGYPGSSGGGVYNYDGRYIGMLVRGGGPGLNFIVPVRRMREWASKMGVLWAMDPSIPVPTTVVRLPVQLTDTPPAKDETIVILSPGGPK
jgi:S1-C subfamily serine protease